MKNSSRIQTVSKVADREVPPKREAFAESIDCYGEDVFNAAAMSRYLPKSVAAKLFATLHNNEPLDPSIATDVAHAMKEWAIQRGATHFTHWFQPLNGGTAEKHDSFLELDHEQQAIFSFSGKNLIVGEPDASSFPSGGLRCTFEARGYTAWDPTSPAFIKRHSNGATLCIPTVFCSYTGEVLDKKTPLLRSQKALQNSVTRLMKCFGLPQEQVKITLGAEQEYFLIDRNFYLNRPDLVQTGRTLFGAPPPKHQQLEDHYFGSIKPRILAFMTEAERELWKLGIPAKTRHNEAAPAQFEIAPIFEDLNLAVDHNMLVMEVLRTVAERHGLVCLLHEKPFAGINGSGKHNNWSLSYGKRNLLDPGSDPGENAIFLTVLAAVLRAVDLHSDLLRAATTGAGNDHRLGGNEAPPAIISVFLGDQLTRIIEDLEKAPVRKSASGSGNALRIGVDTLPPLPRDTTDRNRTTPFAFTGNKFEFRAPGSSHSCAGVNTALNTIAAESMDYIAGELEKIQGHDFNAALQALLKKIFAKHKKVIFNGDNYSAAWLKEAEKRGLPNLRTTMEALKALLQKENQELYARYGVFNKSELDSRYEVFLEEYHRKIHIEGKVALEMARTMILPAVAATYDVLVKSLARAKASSIKAGTNALRKNAERLGEKLDMLEENTGKLEKALRGKHEEILEALEKIRVTVDELELLTDDSQWPLPKYREMLFLY